MRWRILLLALLWIPDPSFPFTPPVRHHHANGRPAEEIPAGRCRGGGCLSAGADGVDEPWREQHDGEGWKLTNNFETFLNQVTIQSLIFLMNSLRDRNTALWLEDFTQPVIRSRDKDGDHDQSHQVLSNMATAMNDALKEARVERPIRLMTYHGLGAINTTLFPTWDSYFERLLEAPEEVFYVESHRPNVPAYEMEINPASLCSRLVSTREQIAREFVNDLNVLAEMSGSTARSYREKAEANEPFEPEPPNLLFLERSVHEDYQPSPLRKGNFDLLLTLSTQEAVHRLLNQRDSESGGGAPTLDPASHVFLQNFYAERVGTHFTGSNFYGRANDFLGALLGAPPVDERVDPARVFGTILEEREKVADEWIDLAMDAPQMHTVIKRLQLNRLMGVSHNQPLESEFE